MGQVPSIVLFGEAEKGEFETAYFCQTLPELIDYIGNPTPNSQGVHCAIQALLYHYNLLFLRVREEGYSFQDYLIGLHLLEHQSLVDQVAALCLPGVGDERILYPVGSYCTAHHSILLTSQSDLYDYLTS